MRKEKFGYKVSIEDIVFGDLGISWMMMDHIRRTRECMSHFPKLFGKGGVPRKYRRGANRCRRCGFKK